MKVTFHPSDICIAVALTDKTIKLYDLRSNKVLQLYRCHENEVNNVQFHPSGNYLYSVSSDSLTKVHTVVLNLSQDIENTKCEFINKFLF